MTFNHREYCHQSTTFNHREYSHSLFGVNFGAEFSVINIYFKIIININLMIILKAVINLVSFTNKISGT